MQWAMPAPEASDDGPAFHMDERGVNAVRLTERERDVLVLMADGLTNRQIAAQLSLEQSTVRWYVRQIYNRLGAGTREEAVAQALDLGLVARAEQPAQPRHNLPGSPTPFIGRARELARLTERLADPAARLVSVIGPGGMGKTRLALAAAESLLQPPPAAGGRLSDRYADGLWFVPLGAVAYARFLAPAFAESLGLQLETTSGRAPLAQLLDYLRQKRMLLVVDNFEHLIEEADFLASIAAAAAGVQLLVTTRERLQLPGEQILSLEGLEVPEPDCASLERLDHYDAAQLFLTTARRVQPDLVLADTDACAVARICQAVAGMPLGIELAASWASVLPLGDIAQELEGSLELLAADRRGIPERHRSMQAALETSWQRLTPGQQAAFQQLCIFRGGFTRAAAFQVAGSTLPLLVTLLNKSWLTYDPAGDRYHIHELLRQYGRLKLAEQPDLEAAARHQHSAHFAARLQRRASDFHTARQQEWVAQLQADLANIQQAWNWAIEAGDAAMIGQMLESLGRFYDWRGRLAEGEAALRQAASRLAGLAGAQPSRVDLSRLWLHALIFQSCFVQDPQEQLGLLNEARGLVGRWPADDPALRVDLAFLQLCLGYHAHGRDRRSAAAHYQQSLALYQALGDRDGMATSFRGLGEAYWALGRLDQAVDSLESALVIRQELGDERGIADVLDTLGLVRKHQGQSEEAERLHRSAVASHRRLGSRQAERVSTVNLAFSLAAAGKYEEMLKVARRAALLAEELGGHGRIFTQVAVAVALKHQGRYPEARSLLLDAATTARQAGIPGTLGFALYWLGQTVCVLGDYGQSTQLLGEARELFAELQQNLLATPGVWLSYTCRAQQDTAGAERQLGQALRLILEQRSAIALYDGLVVAALLAADRGQAARAAELHALSQTFPGIASSRWYADVAGRHLDHMVSRLPAEAAQAALQRGRKLDLWQTAEALAAEFAPA